MTPSPPPRPGGMLAILLVAPFMAQADVTIANVATPSIHADLGASGAALELVIGGYLVAYAVFLITGARLGQTHGYRRVFLVGVGVFTAASLLCGLAPSPVILVAGRVVQGFGAALMFPQALTAIQLHFHGTQRARAVGLYVAALSAGAVCGQILGGVMISADLGGSQWRSVFFVNVPIGAAVLLAARWLLPADEPERSCKLDLVGVGTLSASVLLLVVPLALGRSQGWPLWTWLCLAASVPALAMFLSAQRRIAAGGGSPLVNLRALSRPSVVWGLSSVAAATGTYYALLFTLALYVQQGLGDSPLVSGASRAFAVITAALAAVALSAAVSAQRSVRELTARRRAL
jgi:MFS family permease